MTKEKKEYTNEEKANYFTEQILHACKNAAKADNAYEILHFVRQAYIKAKRLERLLAKGDYIVED